MPQILLTPAAEDDLLNIGIYVAIDNPEAANRIFQAAKETFKLIADMPGIGTVYRTNNALLEGVRFFPVKRFRNYIVYYREITDCIEIVRVLHARMEKNMKLELDNSK